MRNLFAEGKDPFNSKEIITAKYSAAVEISTNDCITFSSLAGSRECKACDAVVFICPHLNFEENAVSVEFLGQSLNYASYLILILLNVNNS